LVLEETVGRPVEKVSERTRAVVVFECGCFVVVVTLYPRELKMTLEIEGTGTNTGTVNLPYLYGRSHSRMNESILVPNCTVPCK